MLKIKDNVDLKELEKFGFEPKNISTNIFYEWEVITACQEECNIKIDINRRIHFNQLSVINTLPNVLYDLIKANLVERS